MPPRKPTTAKQPHPEPISIPTRPEGEPAMAVAPIPATAGQQRAMARSAAEDQRITLGERKRRQDDRYAFGMFSSLRPEHEIRFALESRRGLSASEAKLCLDRVRAIVASWRDQRAWEQRRDAMVIGLIKMRDEHLRTAGIDPDTWERLTPEARSRALADDEGYDPDDDGASEESVARLPGGFGCVDVVQRRLHLIEARAVMDQISKIEGHYAPTRVTGEISHVHAHHMATGPGTVAGIDLRLATPEQRAAIRALLPSASTEVPADVDAAPSVIDADSTELASE